MVSETPANRNGIGYLYLTDSICIYTDIGLFFESSKVGTCFKTKEYLTAVALSRVIMPDGKLQLIDKLADPMEGIVKEAIRSFSKITFKF